MSGVAQVCAAREPVDRGGGGSGDASAVSFVPRAPKMKSPAACSQLCLPGRILYTRIPALSH